MRRRTKCWLISMLTIAVMLAAAGCSGLGNNKRSETAKSALEQKYGEEFDVIETRTSDTGGFYAWLSPASRPELVFRAEMDDEATAISDNYPVRVLCEGLTEKAEQILTEYSEDHFVFTENVMTYMLDEPADVTIDKYLLDNPGDKFYVSIFVEEGADLDKLYGLISRVKTGLGCSKGSIDTFVIAKDKLKSLKSKIEQYDEMTSEEVLGIINEGSRIYINLDPGVAMPTLDAYKQALSQ